MYKSFIKENNQWKIPLHYIKLTHQLSLRNIKLKWVDLRTGSKWFNHAPMILQIGISQTTFV